MMKLPTTLSLIRRKHKLLRNTYDYDNLQNELYDIHLYYQMANYSKINAESHLYADDLKDIQKLLNVKDNQNIIHNVKLLIKQPRKDK